MLRGGLRLRLVIPLALFLVTYGGIYTYFAVATQRNEIFAEACAGITVLEPSPI